MGRIPLHQAVFGRAVVADISAGPAGLVSAKGIEDQIMTDHEMTNDESRALPRVEEILKELEVFRRVHLQSLLPADESGSGRRFVDLDEAALKKFSSYLRLVEKIVRVLERREKLLQTSALTQAPVGIVVQALKDIPELNKILSDPEIKKKIMSLIREKMAYTEKAGAVDN